MTACSSSYYQFPYQLTRTIAPDTYRPGRDPGPLWFGNSYITSAEDCEIKAGDKVSFIYHTTRRDGGGFRSIAKDIRVNDNG